MRIYKIKVNSKTYEVKVMGITEVEPVEVKTVKGAVSAPAAQAAPAAEKPSAAPVANGNGTPVPSPMQGTILDVKVKAGDAVKAGQVLCILEAMKLENEIKAPSDGTVVSVNVTKGQQVNSKDTLVVLG